MERRGVFVVLEGLDGCGKSTQAGRLLARIRQTGWDALHTREPGGTPLGERVRALLLDPETDPAPMAEVFLYQAARAELVARVIAPALEAGRSVVCERWHYATAAYQTVGAGAGDGAPRAAVEETSRLATGGVEPDRAVFLDLPSDEADRRLDGPKDRYETRGASFREDVRAAYLRIFAEDPVRRSVVSAEGPPDDVEQRVWEAVRELFD